MILGLALFRSISTSSARPFGLKVLSDNGARFGCGTCHVNRVGGGSRNPFCTDYERIAIKAGDKYTRETGAMDSDKDEFTNDQEFAGGSHPGDPKSKPAK